MDKKSKPFLTGTLATKTAKKLGRKGDTILAHLSKGEIVIPKILAEDEDFKAVLSKYAEESGTNIEKITVGSGKNSINPKTGLIEFGWNPFKSVKKLFKKATEAIFGKPPEPVKPPPVPDPPPVPVVSSEAEEFAAKEERRKSGVSKTFLTGNLTPKSTGKKTTLG